MTSYGFDDRFVDLVNEAKEELEDRHDPLFDANEAGVIEVVGTDTIAGLIIARFADYELETLITIFIEALMHMGIKDVTLKAVLDVVCAEEYTEE